MKSSNTLLQELFNPISTQSYIPTTQYTIPARYMGKPGEGKTSIRTSGQFDHTVYCKTTITLIHNHQQNVDGIKEQNNLYSIFYCDKSKLLKRLGILKFKC